MSAPIFALPSAAVVSLPEKKKRVLLLDASRPKRDLRAETMRKLGIEVDCAADVAEARCWWRADFYDLVLINLQEAIGPRDKFCDDMRKATPVQQIMFLVGKPEYLAIAPNGALAPLLEETGPELAADVMGPLSAGTSERWGILEACRKISAVRHLSDAKAKAIRERPLPPRDTEMSQSRRLRGRDLLDQLIPENA